MPTWRLNPALTRFRGAVNAAWPNRDKTSDGTIADEFHSASSDHQPDPDGSVDAWDMDVDGVPVEDIKAAFQAHESSLYWIHNDQIARRAGGWKREPYANYAGPGRNRHERHVHWNTRQSHENSTAPWTIKGAPMTIYELHALLLSILTADTPVERQVRDMITGGVQSPAGGRGLLSLIDHDLEFLKTEVAGLRAAVEAIGTSDPDVAAILVGVDERLTALRAGVEDDTRDAVADLAEGGSAAVRADAD